MEVCRKRKMEPWSREALWRNWAKFRRLGAFFGLWAPFSFRKNRPRFWLIDVFKFLIYINNLTE
jgi:hypothetical protein